MVGRDSLAPEHEALSGPLARLPRMIRTGPSEVKFLVEPSAEVKLLAEPSADPVGVDPAGLSRSRRCQRGCSPACFGVGIVPARDHAALGRPPTRPGPGLTWARSADSHCRRGRVVVDHDRVDEDRRVDRPECNLFHAEPICAVHSIRLMSLDHPVLPRGVCEGSLRLRFPSVSAATRNCPVTATKVPAGGHEFCPVAVTGSARM